MAGPPVQGVFVFRGKTYYTLSAYNAAVAAYNASKNKAPPPVKVHVAPKPPPAPVRPAPTNFYAQQAMRLAAEARQRAAFLSWQRAGAVRLAQQQLLARQRAEAAAAMARRRAQYERQVADRRRRLMADAQRQQNAFAAAQRQRQQMTAHRVREDQLSASRRTAWDTLGRRQQVLADQSLQRRRAMLAGTSSVFGAEARRPRARARSLGMRQMAGGRGNVRDLTPAGIRDRNRQGIVDRYLDAGDYVGGLHWLENQVHASDGRFFDEKFYDELITRANTDANKVLVPYEAQVTEINRLVDAGKGEEAARIFYSPEFQALSAQATALVGDGRKPGSMQRLAEITERISRDRESYLERVYLGEYAGRDLTNVDEERIQRFRERFRTGSVLGAGVGMRNRGPGLLDEDIPRRNLSLKEWLDKQYRIRAGEAQRISEMSLWERDEEQGFGHNRMGLATWTDPATGQVWERVPGTADKWLLQGQYASQRMVQRLLKAPGQTVDVSFAELEQLGKEAVGGNEDSKRRLVEYIQQLVASAGDGSRREWSGSSNYQQFRLNEGQVDQILRSFMVERPHGLAAMAEGVMRAPVASQLLGAFGFLGGFVGAKQRENNWLEYGTGGLVQRPELRINDGQLQLGTEDLNDRFTRGAGFLPGEMTDQSPEMRAEFEKVYREYKRMIAEADAAPFWDSWRLRSEAWQYFQSALTTGNLGILYDTAFDPLSYIGPARFVNAGRMAVAEAGGVRAALTGARNTPAVRRALLLDFRRFATPSVLGGASGSDVRLAESLRRLASRSEYDVPQLRLMLKNEPDLFSNIVGRSMRGQSAEEIAEHVEGFAQLWKSDKTNAQQLLTLAQEEFGRQGMRVPPPGELNRLVDEAVEAERVTREAVERAALAEAEVAERAVAAQALHQVRVVREAVEAVPAPAKVPLPIKASVGGVQRKLNRLQVEVRKALDQQAQAARRAGIAGELLKKRETMNTSQRIAAYDELHAALGELEKYQDLPIDRAKAIGRVDAAGNPMTLGIVGKRKAELKAYRTRHGVGDAQITYRDVDKARLQGDVTFIKAQLSDAKAQLARTTNVAQRRKIQARIGRLNAALDGVRIEGQVSKGAAGVVARLRRAQSKVIRETYAATSVARTQMSDVASDAELGRELHARYAQRVVEVEQTFSPKRRAALSRAEQRLAATSLVQVPETQALHDLGRAVGVANVTLAEAFELAQWIRRDYVAMAGFDEAVEAVEAIVLPMLKSMGVREHEYRWFVSYGHQGAAKVMDIFEYRRVDGLVRAEVQRLTGSNRKGALRAPRRGQTPTSARPMVLRDSDPEVLLAKIRIMRSEGYSLNAYDDARSVLGEISRRDLRGRELQRQAKAMAGDSLENFKALREGKRQYEGEADLEQFVNEHLAPDSELAGAGDRMMFDAWVEARRLDDLRPPERAITAYQERILKDSLGRVARLDPDDAAALKGFLGKTNAPPIGSNNRTLLREWLVEQGFWTPKKAEDIASGARVWSIADERKFWESYYGWTPPWTDPVELRPLLASPQAYMAKMREWGFLENDFEKISSGEDLTAFTNAVDAISFGGPGIKRARTYEEMREWFYQRYGDLVSPDGGKTFIEVPWMMTMDEYQAWFFKRADDARKTVDVVDPVTGQLTRQVQAHVTLKELGIDATLLPPAEAEAAVKAMAQMVPAHLDRMRKMLRAKGTVDDMWLPEERMRFAYEIVDAMLTDQHWRAWYKRMPPAQRLLAVAGLQRVFVVMSTAWPIMNSIDVFGMKAIMVSLLRNRGRYVHFIKDSWDNLNFTTREEINGTMEHTWGTTLAHTRINDPRYTIKAQQRAFIGAIGELPMRVSGASEGMLRYNTMVSVAGRTYDDLIAGGMAHEQAFALARMQGMDAVRTFYSVLEDAPEWLVALNQIVPFLTYTYKNSMLGLRVMYEMPWVFQLGQRLGKGIQEWNRERWEEENPGIPFNPDDPAMSMLWFNLPWSGGEGTTYAVDLTMFSDWTRAMDSLTDENKGILGNFLRVPHPIQTAIFGMFFGTETAWGTKADWTQLNQWFELFAELGNPSEFDSINPKSKDLVQWISQMLFFQAFGRVDPIKARVQEFFGLMAVDEDAAWRFYNQHPDLGAYFALNGTTLEPYKMRKISWWTMATDEQVAQYNTDYLGWQKLNEMWDRQADKYYLEPWSREAREYNRLRRAAQQDYLLRHPELVDAWAFTSGPNEFAQLQEDFKVDLEVNDFFAIKAPTRDKFATDLEYANAMLEYLTHRETFLEGHPAVVSRFTDSQNAVERAWYEQELHWSEILEQQAHVKIAIATEEAKLEPDRESLSFLYDLSDENYKRLDAEAFGTFYDSLGPELMKARAEGQRGPSMLSRISEQMGRVRQLVSIPGRADFFYEQASNEERVQIRADEKYHADLGGLMDELKAKGDFGSFWSEMKSRGLLSRYLKENPGKRVDYNYSVNIARIFNKGGALNFWSNLMAEPYWLKQYLARPSAGKTVAEKNATYQRIVVGQRYHGEMQALWAKIGNAPERFYDELAKRPWLQAEYFRRHPEKAGRGGGMSAYSIAIQAIYNASKDGKDFMDRLAANPALQAEYFRRNPDAGAKMAAGKEYFSWMQRWVAALSKNDHAGANAVWEAMPAWVKERYFSAHPGKQAGFAQGSAYSASMGKWVELLKAGKHDQAREYFASLPDWMKERYYAKHPDQRAQNELSNEMLALGAEYFLAPSKDLKNAVLARNPVFAKWLKEHGGKEAEMRGLIIAIYRAIPSSNAWLKRKFRDAYPEVFSKEAAGVRKLARVNAELAAHPEMQAPYERALAIQTRDFTEQLRLSKAPPKPLQYERKKRLHKRQKRRAARMHSQWRHFMELR